MSIRNKLLMVLLLTAVLPLALIRGVQAYSMVKLRERIDTQMRADLTAQAQRELERVAEGYAVSLERDSRLIFALLKLQAAEAERRLNDPVPAQPGRVVSPEAFGSYYAEDPAELPELVRSELHGRTRADQQFAAEPVSYGQPVTVQVQGGGAEDQSAREAAALKLSTMTPVFREVYQQADDLILWQYVALEVGVHVSYPGKSAFAADYDPHQRPWFVQTLQADRPIIVPPQVDQSTRQIVATFAQPIRDRSGRAIGVTAIDIPYSRVLDKTKVRTQWSEQAGLMFLTPYPPSPNRAARLEPDAALPPMDDVYIAANLDAQFQVMDPGTGVSVGEGAATIHFDDPADRAAVLEDLVNRRVGVRRAKIDGRDTMIGYGPVSPIGEPPAFAAILAPTAAITAPAEQVIAEVNAEIQASLINTGVVLAGVLAIVLVLAWSQARRLSQPIIEVAEVANRVAGGDLDAKVTEFAGAREIREVGRAFNAMVPKLRDQIAVREALAVAMQVQQALLPEGAPQVPGLDIAGHSEYCDETGGDYYDFIQLDQLAPNTIAIAVGDVTGHGIAAALLMATGRALIRSRVELLGSLEEVFTGVNQHLCEARFSGRFMTLFYMLITVNDPALLPDAPPITVRYLAAGHDPTLVYRPAEDRFLELAGKDLPLGIAADWTFHELTAEDFQPGDVLVAGTDGIWECFNTEREQFGKERMKDAVRASAAGSAQDITHAVSRAVHAWRGDADQADDITLVVVKVG